MSIRVCSDCGVESRNIKVVDRIPLCADCIQEAFGASGSGSGAGAPADADESDLESSEEGEA